MHLKALTLKGFKSFASPTTLHFEPGITCVVGPNGSGKSNVVDALAWVMGEQGPKALRGGKMEDVIFAGTSVRPPLGRAEVSLTIDNTDGALPIEYAEVTITRLMFRNGGSEYAINGAPARLLDVQELLSDSGVGRAMHVIVGQGQLDAVLAGTPAERRGFIEEAAGVLKHRKRKEKALRKLEATAANMTRLSDLLAELRRQLRPLGRQAEAARRAGLVQAELRDASLRLLADDVAGLAAQRSLIEQQVAVDRVRRDELSAYAATAERRRQELAARVEQARAAEATAGELSYRLSAIRERLSALARLADERVRHAESVREDAELDSTGEDTAAQLAAAEAEQAAHEQELAKARQLAQQARAAREAAEAAVATEQERIQQALRRQATRRETRARLAGAVSARQAAVRRADEEVSQAAARAEAAQARLAAAEEQRNALAQQLATLDAGEAGLDEAYERARARAEEAHRALAHLDEQLSAAAGRQAALTARLEALQLSLARGDADRVLLDGLDGGEPDGGLAGVVGRLAELVRVRPGYEPALTAALGSLTTGIVVDSLPVALSALRRVREAGVGRARLLIAADPTHPLRTPESTPTDSLPPAGQRLIDLVDAPPEVRAALAALIGDVIVTSDLDSAAHLLEQCPGARAVTAYGDLLARHEADGGVGPGEGLLAAQAAADETTAQLAQVADEITQLRAARAAHQQAVAAADRQVDEAMAALNASDAQLSALTEQLGAITGAARAASAEAARARTQAAEAAQAAAAERAALADLQAQLDQAQLDEAQPDNAQLDATTPYAEQPAPEVTEGDRLAARAGQARAAETEARLRVRALEERVQAAVHRRAQAATAHRARQERAARMERRRARAVQTAEVAGTVRAAIDLLVPHVEQAAAHARDQRASAQSDRAAAEAALAELAAATRGQAEQLDALTEALHGAEVELTGLRSRYEALESRAVEELGVDPATLLAEYGPHVPVPQLVADGPAPDGEHSADPEAGDRTEVAGATDAQAVVASRPFVRAEQEQRARAAEQALARLGAINPLALEEYAAVQERTRFLSDQMEDLRATRRSLLGIVDDVDARVQQVFLEALEDTDRAFRAVFARLFPGGEGRLVLTDPDDLVGTGVDVEARPAGKRLRRLSLLSGGERSLTALALLLAIFTARPSPFYVLDEVEAALDDINLGRLLGLLEELRDSSQLIIVTHQKRTMEIADALYGVAMRDDGVTTVISQRLRQAQSA